MSPLRRSLRWRLVVGIALIAATLSTVIGVTVHTLTERDRIARIRELQAERAMVAARMLERTGQTLADAQVNPPGVPARLRAAVDDGRIATYRAAGEQLVVWGGVPLSRLGRRSVRGIYVRAAFPRDDAALDDLRDALVLAGVAGTAVAGLLGALLATGLSRRLRRAAAVADRVAAGDHAARIDVAGSDEVARLSDAVNRMSDALAARLARERRFSSDVAHELRTPLTALTSAAELLDDGRPAQIVRERVGALRGLVGELIELAQLDAGRGGAIAEEELDLGAWATDFAPRRAPEARLELAEPATIVTDRRRLERIVGNLLDNAARHGGPPTRLRVTGAAIEVSDRGAGFPPVLLRVGPQRFWTADGARGAGSGLGLAIAAGHAAAMGAELRFANAGGAVATLRLKA